MMDDSTLTQFAGCSLGELPSDARERIEADPRLLEAFNAQYRVAELMKLKRHEQPDPAMEGRLIYRVSTRIRNGEVSRSRVLPLRGVVFPEWARMLSVVVVMLVLSVWTHREMLHSNEREMNGDLPIAAVEAGRTLSEERGDTLHTASLLHDDAFTTRVPQFHVSFEPFSFPGEFSSPGGLGIGAPSPMALNTNQWNAPMALPVRYPAP